MSEKIKGELSSPALRLFYKIQSQYFDSKSHTIGRVLTIIDATFPPGEQRKAIKDLLTQAYWSEDERVTKRFKEICCQFFAKFAPELLGNSEYEKKFWEVGVPKGAENYFPEN